ncbi:MAG: hypothetical protein MUO76_20450 [Anaerolineaceae bacterium]|nr:hypothetical protein [Anaerolineaceae bacterium]
MRKTDYYRDLLGRMDDWEPFLIEESGLPGPRGNLELLQVVADEGDEELFWYFLEYDPDIAPTNTPLEFVAVCGVVGLGRLLAEGKLELLAALKKYASDPRWRIREGVCMALQRYGRVDMSVLLCEMESWAQGNLLEQRAAVAAICEPALLADPDNALKVLDILDRVTASILEIDNRKSEDFRVLRKGLAYCWSIAAAAFPHAGKALLEKWFSVDDKDILWIMKQNLKKKRLERMDAKWVALWFHRLEEK